MIDQDTGRTKAIRSGVQHLNPRWVRWLDDFVGTKIGENGGYFDLISIFRRGKPTLTRETTEYEQSNWSSPM